MSSDISFRVVHNLILKGLNQKRLLNIGTRVDSTPFKQGGLHFKLHPLPCSGGQILLGTTPGNPHFLTHGPQLEICVSLVPVTTPVTPHYPVRMWFWLGYVWAGAPVGMGTWNVERSGEDSPKPRNGMNGFLGASGVLPVLVVGARGY